MTDSTKDSEAPSLNFIQEIIEADNAAAIMTLGMPLVALGEMEVVPVSEFGEISAAALAAISEQ